MKPFTYHAPTTVAEAVEMLDKYQSSCAVVAGGTDVVIELNERHKTPEHVISISKLDELRYVKEEDGMVKIGALTTFTDLENNPYVKEKLPALYETAIHVGSPQIRNLGTIGGNVCNGVTSADSASTLLTLNAELELTGPDGVRRVKLENFYRGPGKVDLAHGELLTAIRIAKADYDGFGGHYIKYAQRNAMDIATLGCAVHVKLTADRSAVEELRLAFGVAAPTPIRCHKAEELARGRKIGPDLFRTVAEAAAGEVNPRTSWRASKEFRLQLVRELSRRALKQAIIHAGGAVEC